MQYPCQDFIGGSNAVKRPNVIIRFNSGDGIYSLTLTEYPSTGRYRFTIITHDNNMGAFVCLGQEERRSSLREVGIMMEGLTESDAF